MKNKNRSFIPLLPTELKKQLKAKFNTSIHRQDSTLFLECIGNCSSIHLQALTETFIDLDHSKRSKFLSSLRILNKEQAIDVILYLLHHIDLDKIEPNWQKNTPKESLFINCVLEQLLQSVGTFQEQIACLYSIIEQQVTNTANTTQINFKFHANITQFIIKGEPCADVRQLCALAINPKPRTPAEIIEQAHYPSLKQFISNYQSGFLDTILIIIGRTEQLNDKELEKTSQHFWRAYVFFMWVELTQTLADETSSGLQLIDYWLESAIKNAESNPRIYAALTKTLFENNYFSSNNLRYWLQYRFGDKRQIAKKIGIIENLRQERAKPEFIAEQFERLYPIDHKPLHDALTDALQARNHSIYAQRDFLIQWTMWTLEPSRAELYQFADTFSLTLHILLKRTPLAALLPDQKKSIDTLEANNFISLVQTWVFDSESAKNTLLLFLFLHKVVIELKCNTQHATSMRDNLIHAFIAIERLITTHHKTAANFTALYDEMGKHRFFYREVNSELSKIFFHRTLKQISADYQFQSQYNEQGEKILPDPVIEEPVPMEEIEFDFETPATAVKKKKPKKPKQTLPKALVDKPIIPAPVTIEPAPEERVSEADAEEPITPEVEVENNRPVSPEPIIEEPPTALDIQRQIRQQISSILNQLIRWNTSKLDALQGESRLIPHHKKLNESLQNLLDVTHEIRKILKNKNKKNRPFQNKEVPVSEKNLLEQIGHYQQLVKQLIENAPELAELTQQLKRLSYNELVQPLLYGYYKLPEHMPLVEELTSLFSGQARLFVYGSALFISDPLDTDIRLIWNDPGMNIEQINLLFEKTMNQAQLNVEFIAHLINGASYKLKAKGDGYHQLNHKELSITLLVHNPDLRPKLLHHNSHSAAALEPETGVIHCDDHSAECVINGIFAIRDYTTDDRIEAFKIKIHVLTTLMRAWSESKNNTLILSENSIQIIKNIQKHHGDLKGLKKEYPDLEKALVGMIKRHLTHYQASITYQKRTELLFEFLKELKISSADNSLRDMLEDFVSKLKPDQHYLDILQLCQRLRFTQKTQQALVQFGLYAPIKESNTLQEQTYQLTNNNN